MTDKLACSSCGRLLYVNRETRARLAEQPALAIFCAGCIDTLKLEDREARAEYERELRERFGVPMDDRPVGGGHL